MKNLSNLLLKLNSNEEFKNGITNSFYLVLIQGLNYIFPLLTLPYLLTVLSGESFGIYVYSLASMQFAILIVDFGFTINISKKITTYAPKSVDIINIYWLISLIQFLIFLVVFSFFIIFIFTIPFLNIYKWGILTAMISVLGFVFFPNWLFMGLNRIKTLSLINAISKFLTFPFFFILVKSSEEHIIAIFIQSSSLLVAGILSIIVIFKDKSFRKFDWKVVSVSNIWKELRESWSLLLSNSAITVMTTSVTLLLGAFTSAFNVGLFGAIDRIIQAVCYGIYIPVSQAFFPIIARMGVTNFNKAKKIFKSVFYSILTLMVLLLVIFIYFENTVIYYFFKDYKDIQLILSISIAAIIPVALGGVCGQLGLIALGGNKHKIIFSRIYIFICCLSVPISIISIYLFQLHGAIFSMLFAQTSIFVGMLYYSIKYKFL